MDIFKIKWTLWGLDVPAFIWIWALVLILITAFFAIKLLVKVRKQVTLFRNSSKHIRDLMPREYFGAEGIPEGAALESIDNLGKYFHESGSTALSDSWIDYRSHLVSKRQENGEVRFWSSIGGDQLFSGDSLTSETLNQDFYKSLPGIITGMGLLGTFLAILVALLDVRLVDNRVQGLELLIQGLSGKFITSVVALASATLFVFFEKGLFHALEKSQARIASLIDRAIPQISSVQVLVDLHTVFFNLRNEMVQGLQGLNENTQLLKEDVANQTVCIQDFNTSLAPMLQQTFDESMTPTLNRMVTSIEEMNEFLRSVEANKNDSITDSIHGLMTSLQESITGSISEMGGRFNESLSGSAQQQFAAISTSLADTTGLLDSMNTQFAFSQTALQEMIELTRSTTKEQISISQNQLSSLSEAMDQLMTSLTVRVDELGERMSDSVQTNSKQAMGAAELILDRAEEWSSENAARLTQLLETHGSQLDRVVQTRELLDTTLKTFSQSLDGLLKISLSSEHSVQLIDAAVDSIANAAEKVSNTHQSLQTISNLTAGQLRELESAHLEQKEIWRNIYNNLDEYKKTFGSVESSAQVLLEHIQTSLENYQQVCEKGFNKLIETSDNHFANATQKLGSSVSELDEVLQDLSESFTRFEEVRNNGGR